MEDRGKGLQEALAREAAARDVLRAMSQSQADYRPVFDVILEHATKLCDAVVGLIYIRRNDGFHLVAARGGTPAFIEFAYANPLPLDPQQSVTGQAAAERRPIQALDLEHHELTQAGQAHRTAALKLDTIRTQLSVPMVRDDNAVGVMVVFRRVVDAFDFGHIELLTMFAAQAVAAVDNVRQFRAMQARDQELNEAQQRLTAVSQVMRVVSSAASDYQRVFDAILDNACRLCDAPLGVLFLAYEDGLRCMATRGARPEFVEYLRQHPAPMDPTQSVSARAMFECVPLQGENLAAEQVFLDNQPHHVAAVAIEGARSFVSVPMHKDRQPFGIIALYRHEERTFEHKLVELIATFADQAVIAMENLRLHQAVEARSRDHAEALKRQTATTGILRAMRRSPADYQPVFDTILDSAARACDAPLTALYMRRADALELVALRGGEPKFAQQLHEKPLSLNPEKSYAARAVIECKSLRCEDIADEPVYDDGDEAALKSEGVRSCLYIPLRKGDQATGVITLHRRTVRPFDDADVELVTTFADQAVIATESSRQSQAINALTQELSEALGQQSATNEILRTIKASPDDYTPVFDAILGHATRLCDAPLAALFMRQDDGFHLVSHKGAPPEFVEFARTHPVPLDPALTLGGRAAHERVPLQTVDRMEDQPSEADQKKASAAGEIEGIRTYLAVPLVKGQESIGILVLYRREVRAFGDSHVALITAFADQAVIAMESVRLSETVLARTEEVAKALERQHATNEILRTLGDATMDNAAVFTTILDSATKLCDAPLATLMVRQADEFRFAAHKGAPAEFVEHAEAHLLPADSTSSLEGLALQEGSALQIEDVAREAETSDKRPHFAEAVKKADGGTCLAVPLIRNDETLGIISLYRREVRPFEESRIALLADVAEVAAVAIDDMRQWQELTAETEDEQSVVDERTDVAEADDSGVDLETVLTTIVDQAVTLTRAHGGVVCELDEASGELTVRAVAVMAVPFDETAPFRLGEGVMGRAVETREPVQIADVDADADEADPLRSQLHEHGLISVLAVPLLHAEDVLGALMIARETAGEFDDDTVALLGTYAAQCATAFHGARLFREIEQKGRALEAANQRKTALLTNLSQELRSPLDTVIGFSEVLAGETFGQLSDKQKEYLESIRGSGRDLQSLINCILDLSRIESGRMELDLSRIELRPALDSALTLVGERATRRNIVLETDIDDELGEMTGDARKLKQILLNLLSNAINFSPEGGTVTLAAHRENGSLHLAVRDTATGASANDQQMSFAESGEVATGSSRQIEDTDVGLTLTRRFVELLGGEIDLDTTLGEGSEFRIVLPVEPPEKPAEATD